MQAPVRILLQTTIPAAEDDWHIGRFSLLQSYLESLTDETGHRLFDVTSRNRSDGSADPIMGALDRLDYDELWLFAVDAGDGISVAECQAISRFHERGGGLMVTRDHQDVGASVCNLAGVGQAHHFHTRNPDPDVSRQVNDDRGAPDISWPNYHSGRNGDFQNVRAVDPIHALLLNPDSPSGTIKLLPAHPHEGAIDAPPGEKRARVIATGQSTASGRPFNLLVAFDSARDTHGNQLGRGVVTSSFHHFANYNWDPRCGCPSFVSEPPGDEVLVNPSGLEDVKAFVRNVALWIAPTRQLQ